MHFVGVDLSVLSEAIFADLVEVKEGDGCPRCNGTLSYTKGIEVGHIFKLGTTYSKVLKAEFLNEKGQAEPFVMGTYGMGVSRLVAAVIEQHHDEKGCQWTRATAPYTLNILVSNVKDEAQNELGELLYGQFLKAGTEVIFDDRKERFGFKMNDAELIGFPFTLIIGKGLEQGVVELYVRQSGEKVEIPIAEAFVRVMERL